MTVAVLLLLYVHDLVYLNIYSSIISVCDGLKPGAPSALGTGRAGQAPTPD